MNFFARFFFFLEKKNLSLKMVACGFLWNKVHVIDNNLREIRVKC